MDHVELHDALSWLRGAVLLLERGTPREMSLAEREEWEQALEHKRSLLHRLEVLNAHLLQSAAGVSASGVGGDVGPRESPSEMVA